MSEPRTTVPGPAVAGPAAVTPTSVTGDLPDGLLEAFTGYEDALARNDLAALDAYFAPGESTLRGDATGLLVGHDAISGFRGARSGTLARGIRSLHVRVIDPRHAVIVSVNTPDAGGAGLVTQLWVQGDTDSWRVEVAQVAAPPAAVNPTVWRLVGTPLVPAATDTGPLAGETVAVKDLFDLAGFTVGAGNPAYLGEATPATVTAPAVAALLGAGASVRGVAQTDEFAYSIAGDNEHYGTPPNVRVPGGLPGGSSSGPAAAVALGQASIGLATDTAGSIRVPASYQGLWGLRSTHDAVDRTGLLPLAPTFDTVGWLTRTPAVLRAAAAASLDPARQVALVPTAAPTAAPEDALTNPPARFAVSTALVFAADDDVQAAFVTGLDRLIRAGLLPEPDLVDVGDLAEALRIFRAIQTAEAWRCNGDWVTAHPGALGAAVASRFEIASRTDPAAEAEARVAMAAARARLDAVLDGRILLLPSASSTAPSRHANAATIDATRTATLTMTSLAGIGGYPALSVPLFEVHGKPVGLCLVGPRYSDLALVDVGAELAAGG
ncbi:AtzH-like domain-containing protein [Cryobacterium arcticum]|uniref:Glutamyl-tRNA amidotransferase n=1 Tax=Cryobacterium arcticum TaxID=670052 RepID=A0A1B1BIZ6_9MICO|nr:AtzH-like domain-containing protein [Cryobacterium arcticum]ANP72413.1 glutamyl-tRNA amidotransferase [Cryobacterium arcticum]